MSASKAEILRYIAESEPLERTLEVFPQVSRGELQQLLVAISHALEPGPVAGRGEAQAADAQVDAGDATPSPPRRAARGAKTAPPAASGRVSVYSDGAARGNPGPAGAGAVLVDDQGKIERLGKFLGRQTNNVAEYQGVILGLEAALARGAKAVDVFADSQLLIRQLQGKYQVKNAGLRPLFEHARKLLARLGDVTLTHIPREENGAADEMSNRAVDERM